MIILNDKWCGDQPSTDIAGKSIDNILQSNNNSNNGYEYMDDYSYGNT